MNEPQPVHVLHPPRHIQRLLHGNPRRDQPVLLLHQGLPNRPALCVLRHDAPHQLLPAGPNKPHDVGVLQIGQHHHLLSKLLLHQLSPVNIVLRPLQQLNGHILPVVGPTVQLPKRALRKSHPHVELPEINRPVLVAPERDSGVPGVHQELRQHVVVQRVRDAAVGADEAAAGGVVGASRHHSGPEARVVEHPGAGVRVGVHAAVVVGVHRDGGAQSGGSAAVDGHVGGGSVVAAAAEAELEVPMVEEIVLVDLVAAVVMAEGELVDVHVGNIFVLNQENRWA